MSRYEVEPAVLRLLQKQHILGPDYGSPAGASQILRLSVESHKSRAVRQLNRLLRPKMDQFKALVVVLALASARR